MRNQRESIKAPWRKLLSGILLRPDLLATFITLLVYLLLPTREFYWDGIGFAQAIETSKGSPTSLFYPNHLVYNLVGYVVWRAAAAVGLSVRALYLLQALNALFAAAGVYVVWHISETMTGSARRSTCCAILFAFSATWWRFSTDADAYIPSVLFLLICFHLLRPLQHPRPIAAGLAHCAAMLFHQLALFFFPVAVIALLRQQIDRAAEDNRKSRLRRMAMYALAAGIPTGLVYGLAFSLVRPHGNIQEFWNWMTVHSPGSVFAVNLWHSARFALRGTMRLFVGGRVTQMQPGIVTAAGALAFCAAIVLLLRQAVRLLTSLARTGQHRVSHGFHSWLAAHLSSLVWVFSYVLFLSFWLPQNTFYRLFYFPPLILLLVAAPIWCGDRFRLLLLLTAAVCAWNFTVLIYPHTKAETNEVLAFALRHQQDWKPGCTILYRNFHSDLWTISYFNAQASWVALDSPDPGRLAGYLAETASKGRPLWLEGTAYDAVSAMPEGERWLNQHIDGPNSLLQTTPPHTFRFYRAR